MRVTREERIYNYQTNLRRTLLDQPGLISYTPARDLASPLLLYLDDTVKCWQLCTDWLRSTLKAERVDGGYATPLDKDYFPGQGESICNYDEIPSIKGVKVNNADEGVRLLWRSSKPIVFSCIAQERRFGEELRRDLLDIGVSSKIAIALRSPSGPFALLCADRVKRNRGEWSTHQYDIFECTTKEVIGPILEAALELSQDTNDPLIPLRECLSDAELRVAELTALGFSYKEIARELDRSIHTVDHQLRSIRVKLQMESHAKLARYLSQILDKVPLTMN